MRWSNWFGTVSNETHSILQKKKWNTIITMTRTTPLPQAYDSSSIFSPSSTHSTHFIDSLESMTRGHINWNDLNYQWFWTLIFLCHVMTQFQVESFDAERYLPPPWTLFTSLFLTYLISNVLPLISWRTTLLCANRPCMKCSGDTALQLLPRSMKQRNEIDPFTVEVVERFLTPVLTEPDSGCFVLFLLRVMVLNLS